MRCADHFVSLLRKIGDMRAMCLHIYMREIIISILLLYCSYFRFLSSHRFCIYRGITGRISAHHKHSLNVSKCLGIQTGNFIEKCTLHTQTCHAAKKRVTRTPVFQCIRFLHCQILKQLQPKASESGMHVFSHHRQCRAVITGTHKI